MADRQDIKIAVVFDDNYLNQALVVVTSVLLNNILSSHTFYFIAVQLSQKGNQFLESFINKFRLKASIINLNDQLFKNLPQYCHISRSTYVRLTLDEILPNEDKVLYLDCDLLVECDLTKLWTTNFAPHPIAAVPERGELQMQLRQHVGMDNGLYINAGVCLINLKKWKELGLKEKCIAWIENNPERATMMDQDAMNAVLLSDIHYLPIEFNFNPIHQLPERALRSHPNRIIHCAGPLKPWHSWYDFFLRDLFWFYARVAGVQDKIEDRGAQSVGQHLCIANQNCARRNFEQAAKSYYSIIRGHSSTKMNKPKEDKLKKGLDAYNEGNFMQSTKYFREILQESGFVVDHVDPYRYPDIQFGLY